MAIAIVSASSDCGVDLKHDKLYNISHVVRLECPYQKFLYIVKRFKLNYKFLFVCLCTIREEQVPREVRFAH